MSETPYPIIMNGDHAEFEAEHVNTRPEDRPDWPLPSFDARDWAKNFCEHFGLTKDGLLVSDDDAEDIMLGWFANSLMRGFDEAQVRSKTSL